MRWWGACPRIKTFGKGLAEPANDDVTRLYDRTRSLNPRLVESRRAMRSRPLIARTLWSEPHAVPFTRKPSYNVPRARSLAMLRQRVSDARP